MEITYAIVILCLVVSNIYTLYRLKKKPQKEVDKRNELQVLGDLLNYHQCMVKLTRVDPSEFFLRSPKEQ